MPVLCQRYLFNSHRKYYVARMLEIGRLDTQIMALMDTGVTASLKSSKILDTLEKRCRDKNLNR
ncbi:Uncharacterized protein APZ42_034262 [Daphnia magna]|uniref:Uncharacterized protein n=1 Tax=Daphnia magna TaxID=35525 RepID=A0A162CEB0_9CRUS|nr:Uncharacterized protein APZ42_034262 [Daphnia magna]